MGPHVKGPTGRKARKSRATMPRDSLRLLTAGLSAAMLFVAWPTFAQSTDQKPAEKPQASDPKEAQKKIDEFAEAERLLGGPAANPECLWLGRRVVSLLWRDDLDTAFRHLDLYDRFGCPGGHVQATFRCLTRFGSQIDDKVPRSLGDRIHACWINPASQPQAAVAANPAPAPATAGSAPAPAAPPQPAASPAPPAK
jgi:hypothetical protein